MQIRLSWQALIAAVIFIIALGLIGRTALRGPRASTATPDARPAMTAELGPSSAPTSNMAASPTAAAAVIVTPSTQQSSATITVEPSATLPPPTAVPSETPTDAPPPTLAPSQTPFVVPTREPTPVVQRLVVERVGFGQRDARISYGFVVSNPNQNLLLRNSIFQVAIYNAEGTVLRTDAGVIPLLGPGQELGVAKVLPVSEENVVNRIEVLLREGAAAVTTQQVPGLPIEKQAFVAGGIQRITGIIKNPLSYDLENLNLVGIIYEGGQIVGGGAGLVPFIPAQGQAAIDIETVTSAAPDKVELYPIVDTIGGQ